MKCIWKTLTTPALTMAGVLLLITTPLPAQEVAEEPAERESPVAVQELSPELMRSFLHLQEQVHATQLAVERSRFDAETAAARNTEALNARLRVIETALDQAQRDSSAAMQEASRQIQEASRQTMLYAGLFATLGFLALAVTAWLQWKAASRLTTLPSAVGFPALPPAQGYGVLGLSPAGQTPNLRLMDALGRLEHRIADLEVSHHEVTPAGRVAGTDALDDDAAGGGELAGLIKEGEQLLAREQAEKAIQLFDSILAKHPGHPEVLLRKGAALERLRKDQEAIECYDQAIRADSQLTMAYLHKGGLYNRMEKFAEAMECYEQALKVQEAGHAHLKRA
jgi:tetratricopeptide (TPR) repeat protein